jgi:hypothetical protein
VTSAIGQREQNGSKREFAEGAGATMWSSERRALIEEFGCLERKIQLAFAAEKVRRNPELATNIVATLIEAGWLENASEALRWLAAL